MLLSAIDAGFYGYRRFNDEMRRLLVKTARARLVAEQNEQRVQHEDASAVSQGGSARRHPLLKVMFGAEEQGALASVASPKKGRAGSGRITPG